MFNFPQLCQKCLFRVLVQIKTQTKPTHCIWLSCCIVEPRVSVGLSECWLLPTPSPAPSAWIALHALLLGPEPKGHSQAPFLQPLHSVACATGTLGYRGHCSQLFPSENHQVGLQHPKGDLISVYFAGKPRCSRTPGNNRPKGSSCKWPRPTQTEGRLQSTLPKPPENKPPGTLG